MAQSTRSVESLVKLTYALQIATRCSEDAESICRKNHLSFPELLRPFSVLSEKGELLLVCVCVRERERVCVCERERESECVCVAV